MMKASGDVGKWSLTSKQVCFFYQITKTTLSNWTGKGFPKTGRNCYPLVAGFRWVCGNVFMETTDELKAARLRRERARAWREELDARARAGELVEKDAALTWLISLGSAAKLGFQGLPKRLAPIVRLCDDEKEIEIIIREEIYKIIRNLENAGKGGK